MPTHPSHRLPQGWASRTLPPAGQAPDNPSMAPLLETLLEHVAPPPTEPLNGGWVCGFSQSRAEGVVALAWS